MSGQMAAARFNTPEHTIFDHHVICLAGDGCMQEGVAMEACAFAGHQVEKNVRSEKQYQVTVRFDDGAVRIRVDATGRITSMTTGGRETVPPGELSETSWLAALYTQSVRTPSTSMNVRFPPGS